MTRDEALAIKAELDAQGSDATVITFDDGKCGVLISTKAGPSVGVAWKEQLDTALEMVKSIEGENR